MSFSGVNLAFHRLEIITDIELPRTFLLNIKKKDRTLFCPTFSFKAMPKKAIFLVRDLLNLQIIFSGGLPGASLEQEKSYYMAGPRYLQFLLWSWLFLFLCLWLWL